MKILFIVATLAALVGCGTTSVTTSGTCVMDSKSFVGVDYTSKTDCNSIGAKDA